MAEPTIQLGGGNWAGKSDNLLGYYKEGERFYKQDFTFSRSTTGTYTDSDGYIQEMPYNKLLQSNTFNTSWSNSGTTETSGQSGYDGTNNAWLLEKSQSDGYIYQNISQSNTQTISVYAKSGSIGGIQIYINAGTTRFQNYNLDNGTLIGTGDNESSSIENVGGGWYRCIVTINDSATRIRFYPTTNTGDKSGTSGSIYIQNAQLVKGTSAKTYFPTTTRLNMPRVDYLNNSNGSLILEPQRSNLITYSSAFDNAAWNKSGASIVSGKLSPSGDTNAFKLVENTANSLHFIESINIGGTGVKTFTIFVNAKEVSKIGIRDAFSTGAYTSFDLTTGSVITEFLSNGTISQYGNDFYRISITQPSYTGNSRFQIFLLPDSYVSGSLLVSYLGDGVSGLDIYGSQAELGSYPTTLINTSGSSVTRNADACSLTNVADRIGQTEGTMFLDFVLDSVDGTLDFRFQLYGNNSVNNWVFVGMTNGDIRAYVNDTTNQFDSSFSGVVGTRYKLALAYKENDFAFYANGIQKSVSTSGTIPSLDSVSLGDSVTSANMVVKESVNQVQIYNTRLSNSELAELTTL
jgi:hypothetical protein